MTDKQNTCCYENPDGWRCDEPANPSGFCYWHDPNIDKSHDAVKEKVEAWAQSGRPLDGFQLARTNLEDINLVNSGKKEGYQCRNADFYRANLSRAHFFKLDLRGTSLMKANLFHANLHCAKINGCNVLGTDFTKARLENIEWGHQLKQEKLAKEAKKAGNKTLANCLYQEAEEVCRNIRKQCEKQGLFETAGVFFKREMRFRRYQLPRWSYKRWISKVVDLFCGYGEEPWRVVVFSLCLILTCAAAYFVLGTVASQDNQGSYLIEFLNALYFSVVTFTTLGYGDISPVGVARIIAAIEAFLGSFTMALFVVVFVKKMTR